MGKKTFGASGSRKKTRKEKRKEQRILKKVKKNEHYFKRFKKQAPTHPSKIRKDSNTTPLGDIAMKSFQKDDECDSKNETILTSLPQEKNLIEKIREASEKSAILAEKRKASEKKARNAQLREANKAEDKQIKHLSTLMKMNKRKKKGKIPALPKIFATDGLDYLLDVTDPDKLKDMKLEEPTFEDGEGEGDFERDLALATGGAREVTHENDSQGDSEEMDSEDKAEVEKVSDEGADEEEEQDDVEAEEAGNSESADEAESEEMEEDIGDEEEAESASDEAEVDGDIFEGDGKLGSDFDALEGGSDTEEEDDIEEETGPPSKKQPKRKLAEDQNTGEAASDQKKVKKERREGDNENGEDGVWEDIYGRMRGKDGSILTGVGSTPAAAATAAAGPGRYVPPALRAQQLAPSADDQARRAQLRRRLQGQLNRLSAASARGVLALLEELYASHSRHDTSQTLTELVHEACVSQAAVRPDRMLMEHVLLLAALHANVGSEVGAHFLLKTIQRFHKLLMDEQRDDENKELDNLVMLLAHLYLFRVTDSIVIYDILKIMVERFSAKDVELILTVLRSVGFTMRKDDPAALKELILRLQAQATAANSGSVAADSSRIRFLLDIVMALRNNNMAKIPHYDPALGQELNKLLKTLVNPNQTLTELSISMEDLLKAEERGKWWVVGSAWSGALKERQADGDPAADGHRPAPPAGRPLQHYSAQLLELARQQRMNTDLRRNVFCVLMTAEDYMDGFEKLMRLGLKGPQQEQEMTTVIVGCALRERTHNPYYSHLLDRLCGLDRKYQMRVKISVWEHLKQLPSLGSGPASNLAKILVHLISSGQLTIAVLKVIEFSEMSKAMVRFLRQLLLALLMGAEDTESARDLFQRACGPQLKHLRDSLVLFIHHFVLRNKHKLSDAETVQRLEERAKAAVGVLKAAEGTLRL